MPDTEFDPERVVVRDKRRLDPESGELREVPGETATEPAGQTPPAPAGDETPEQLAEEEDKLAAELTADLQRLSAEYANYRKRVERDRLAMVEAATAGLLGGLLPLLDDIERARQHDDLTGAFRSVGEGLEALTDKLGLQRFGAVGEPFDPQVHEAVMAAEPDPSASVAVCAQVLQPGFRLASGRVLRPARVAVAEPAAPPAPSVDTEL
ncbi:MAG: GrpE protein [Frankiales bacterium]|nr:GrpE protein [Frankiales bacterium]